MESVATICLTDDDTVQNQAHGGVSDLEDVASYNWLDKPNPTTLVPSIPPVWSVPKVTHQLKPATGIRHVDQNGGHDPRSPLEPRITAATTTYLAFDFNCVDTGTDRQPIGHLLDFAGGGSEDFVVGVEVLGDVALLVRMEKQTREIIPPGKFKGYPRAFEEAFAKIHRFVACSTSHHPIIPSSPCQILSE
jgi:hypothetical protein